jgi:hypothetical protein
LITDFLYGIASNAIASITSAVTNGAAGQLPRRSINMSISAKQSVARFPLITAQSISETGIFKVQKKMEYLIASFIRLYMTNARSFIGNDADAKFNILADVTGDRTTGGAGKATGLIAQIANFGMSFVRGGSSSASEGAFADVKELDTIEVSDISEYLNNDMLFDSRKKLEDAALGAVAPVSGPAMTAPVSESGATKHPKGCTCEACQKAEKGDTTANEGTLVKADRDDEFVTERKAAIIERKSDESEPVIVTSTVTIVDKTGKIGGTTDISIGVKCPIHIFPSEQFISSIISGFSQNNLFIRLMKWRAGEISFMDAFLNKAAVDMSIVANHKSFKGRAKTIKEILAEDKYKRNMIFGSEKEGCNILVITDEEVREIERRSGKNLLDSPATAIRLCKNQKLFGLMIYDEVADSGKFIITDYSDKFENVSFKEKGDKGTDDVIKNIFGALRR